MYIYIFSRTDFPFGLVIVSGDRQRDGIPSQGEGGNYSFPCGRWSSLESVIMAQVVVGGCSKQGKQKRRLRSAGFLSTNVVSEFDTRDAWKSLLSEHLQKKRKWKVEKCQVSTKENVFGHCRIRSGIYLTDLVLGYYALTLCLTDQHGVVVRALTLSSRLSSNVPH